MGKWYFLAQVKVDTIEEAQRRLPYYPQQHGGLYSKYRIVKQTITTSTLEDNE